MSAVRTTPSGEPPNRVVHTEVVARLAGERRNDDTNGDAVQASPSTLIIKPGRRRPRANAYQSPSAAIHTPTSSPQVAAATAQRANGSSRSESRNQMPKRRSGIDERQRVEPVHRHPRHPRDTRDRRARAARHPLRAEVPPAEPKTGRAPSATATIWTATSVRGDGATIQKGASAARIGSTCCPTRRICSPVTPSVTSSSAAVRRAPDSLRHVSEVVARKPEVGVEVAHVKNSATAQTNIAHPNRDGPGVSSRDAPITATRRGPTRATAAIRCSRADGGRRRRHRAETARPACPRRCVPGTP